MITVLSVTKFIYAVNSWLQGQGQSTCLPPPPQLTSLLFWRQRLLCQISDFRLPKLTALALDLRDSIRNRSAKHIVKLLSISYSYEQISLRNMLKIYKLGFLCIYLFASLFSFPEKASRRYTVQKTLCDRDRPKYVMRLWPSKIRQSTSKLTTSPVILNLIATAYHLAIFVKPTYHLALLGWQGWFGKSLTRAILNLKSDQKDPLSLQVKLLPVANVT